MFLEVPNLDKKNSVRELMIFATPRFPTLGWRRELWVCHFGRSLFWPDLRCCKLPIVSAFDAPPNEHRSHESLRGPGHPLVELAKHTAGLVKKTLPKFFFEETHGENVKETTVRLTASQQVSPLCCSVSSSKHANYGLCAASKLLPDLH